MKIGIIGSGAIGGTIGQLWAQAGHKVLFSSRHPEELSDLVAQAGANASTGTVREAAQFGEVILLAVKYYTIEEALQQVEDGFNQKIVIDATNPFKLNSEGNIERINLNESTAGRIMAQRLSSALIVKAFTSVYAGFLKTEAHREGEPLAIPLAGDDEAAKKTVSQLVKDAGYFPVDIGTLDQSESLDPGGVLWNSAITKVEVLQSLELSR